MTADHTTTLVCFRTSDGHYALPVESTLGVRRSDGLVELPAPRPDVVGVLPGDPPISVLSVLGVGRDHILVAMSDGAQYGVHVLEVLGVRRIDDDRIGPAPRGQQGGLISGIVDVDGDMVLIADATALAARL
jgi:chemotaxis signal transduction protein